MAKTKGKAVEVPKIDKNNPPKAIAKGPKTVNPAWVEKIAECGVMHHLATEGIIVAKPMVDFKGTDLIAFTEQTGVLGYVQVKGRQTANKQATGSDVFIPTDKMTPVVLPLWIDQDPLWFVIVYWVQEQTYLVFTGEELVNEFMTDDGPKLLYQVGEVYKFQINKAKLEFLRKNRDDIVSNFRKIAEALMAFPPEDTVGLYAMRHRLFIRLAKEAEDAYRNSAANKRAKDALKAASVTLPPEVQGPLEEGLPDEEEDSKSS